MVADTLHAVAQKTDYRRNKIKKGVDPQVEGGCIQDLRVCGCSN